MTFYRLYYILFSFSDREFIISIEYEYLALKSIKGVSDNTLLSILEKRGSLKNIFSEKQDFFYSSNIPSNIVARILSCSFNEQAIESHLKRAESNNIKIITFEDVNYPKLLKEIYSPPTILFVKGDIACLNNVCVGIVGSRSCSKMAENFSYKLSKELSSVGITIVSGFAYGIDISAHRGAMEVGSTACVLGSGLLNIYPANHIKYIDKILNKGGCILSEFTLDEAPLPANFPRRNRIISGLSKAIAVIEAGIKSGSLITTRFALEQNREIFAVPTFPGGRNSATNMLLKQGAKFLESSLDIISELQYDLKIKLENNNDNVSSAEKVELDDEIAKNVYNALSIEPLSLNSICIKLNIDIATASSCIALLELDGLVEKDHDEKYIIK